MSVYSLMRDGTSLAGELVAARQNCKTPNELSEALAKVVSPYIQIINNGEYGYGQAIVLLMCGDTFATHGPALTGASRDAAS